jgi:transcription elongation factor Elf1
MLRAMKKMESNKQVNCPKCGREVVDRDLAAGAGGDTVLCKGCGALISLRESVELAAKGELDSDFDLEICFEDESGPEVATVERSPESLLATGGEPDLAGKAGARVASVYVSGPGVG